MKRGLDWYKREPRAIIDAKRAAKMSTRTAAVYDLLIDLIYEGGGQTPDDPAYVAGHFSDIGTAAARREISRLVDLGKLHRDGDFLTNERAKNQAKTKQKLSETRAEIGRKGGVSSGFSRRQSSEINDIGEANASSKREAEKRESIKETPNGVSKRGRRIPDEWRPSAALGRWAMEKYGWPREEVSETADAFVDHWRAASGQVARKTDWDAAFRSWCRKKDEFRRPSPRGPSGGGLADDPLARKIRRFAPGAEDGAASGDDVADSEGGDDAGALLPFRPVARG